MRKIILYRVTLLYLTLISCNNKNSHTSLETPENLETFTNNMEYNHTNLAETEHMLNWLHPKPVEEIRNQFVSYVEKMSPGSNIEILSVTSEPQWLTGGRKESENDEQMILTRAGVAFAFILRVKGPGHSDETVSGVFTWVGVNLDVSSESEQRNWIDISGTLEEFGSKAMLITRLYNIDSDD